MKRLLFSLIFIISAFIFSVPAQTPVVRKTFERAVKSANESDFKTALTLFQAALDSVENERIDDNFRAKLNFNIGVCFYRLKKADAAAVEFTKTIEISKGNYPRVFYALGMAQTDLRNWSEAEKAFEQSIKSNKTDGEAWFDLAMVYLAEKQFETAQTAFQNAVNFHSTATADAHNNLGVIFALKHDFQSAESEFETAISTTQKKSAEAENNLRFCKLYRQNADRELTAKFEFSKIQMTD